MRTIIVFVTGILCTSFCYGQSVTYQTSSEDFPNPERGFYRPLEPGYASDFVPLTADGLISNRTTSYQPYAANYEITNTLIFRYYVLDSFKKDSISEAYLENVRNDLTTIREAGVKIIIRFAYTIAPEPSQDCEDKTACPPYGDAEKKWVLAHIKQLQPIFADYYDVIAVVQMGFIGIWGEQYYTDFFGDTSANGDQNGKLSSKNWQDRIDVLNALLEAVPDARMIQVRYPQIKQKAVYGVNAPVTSAPVSATQAHNGSPIARIGFHNDCFLSSPDDFGTYFDYSNSEPATETLKPYFAADSRYTVVGGETCSNSYDKNNCPGAVAAMEALHYSYLNSEYDNEVNNDWKTGGCIESIKKRLGYRLVMQQGTYATQVKTGGTFDFSLNVTNVGFAAPYNSRLVALVLRDTASGATHAIPLTGEGADIRFWLPGEMAALSQQLTLPSSVPAGTYELLLHLPDTSNNNIIANRPEYAIRLANKDTWEAAMGYNKLNHTLTVTSGTPTVDNALPDPNQWYYLENRAYGLRLETDACRDNGPVGIVGGQNPDKQWRFVPVGDGYYALQNRNCSQTWLETDGCNNADGDVKIRLGSNSSSDVHWKLVKADTNYYYLENRACGAFLDADSDKSVDILGRTGRDRQWKLIPVQANARLANSNPAKSKVASDTERQLVVYPNPSPDGTIRLQLSGFDVGAQVQVIDMKGNTVYQIFYDESQSELAQRFARGLYVVRVSDAQGTLIEKLVVE